MSRSIVSLRNVSVAYDGELVIRNASLEIFDDDFIGIIGPNGGGKTTLVKSILGLVSHEGEIALSPELYRNGRRLIGYMPQQSAFDRSFPISVEEVVLSGLQGEKGLFGRYTSEDRKRVAELLDLTLSASKSYVVLLNIFLLYRYSHQSLFVYFLVSCEFAWIVRV